jgi:hypothetical protein
MTTQYSDYPTARPAKPWQDWANLILAIWLFISPWVLQFGAGAQTAPAGAVDATGIAVSHAAWNAWVLGVIVFLVALSTIGNMEVWQEWFNIVLGVWIFIAPWVLGFVGFPRASWDHWIVGALIFLLAIWSVSRARTVAPPVTSPIGNRPPRA